MIDLRHEGDRAATDVQALPIAMLNKKLILALAIALAPVLGQVAWHAANQQLPISDAGASFRAAYLSYLAFQEGMGSGLYSVFHAEGRPILFSAFAVPFVALRTIDERLPAAAFLILVQALAASSYLWLLSYKTDILRAAVLTALITTSPFIFALHTWFMPEVLWHLWFVLFLATLLRSEGLTRRTPSIASGIFLGLAVLARPAESVVLLTPLLLVYFAYLWHEERVSLRRLISSVALCLVTAIGCSSLNWYWPSCSALAVIIIGLSSSLLILVARNRQPDTQPVGGNSANEIRGQSCSEYFFLGSSALISAWLAFYFRPIYFWTYDNSFGAGAKTNDQVNLSRNILAIFGDLAGLYGVATLGALALVGGCLLLLTTKTPGEKRRLFYGLAALAAIVGPMLCAYSSTGTSDARRILLGMVFAFTATAYYFCCHRFTRPWVGSAATTFLASVAVVQFLAIAAMVGGAGAKGIGMQGGQTLTGRLEFSGRPDSHKSLDAEVITAIKSLGLRDCRIAVFSLGLFSQNCVYEVERLQYVTLEMDPSLRFGTVWAYANYEPFIDVVRRISQQGYQYVLLECLDDPIEDPTQRRRMRSHTFFVSELLGLIRERGAQSIPYLKLVGDFDVGGRRNCLFEVRHPDGTVVASSQLREYGPGGMPSASNPGWHAHFPVTYPQSLEIDFGEPRSVRRLQFLPQSGCANRAPREIRIEACVIPGVWNEVFKGELAHLENPEEWGELTLFETVNAQRLRVHILSNWGDPYLTLRGLRFDGASDPTARLPGSQLH